MPKARSQSDLSLDFGTVRKAPPEAADRVIRGEHLHCVTRGKDPDEL